MFGDISLGGYMSEGPEIDRRTFLKAVIPFGVNLGSTVEGLMKPDMVDISRLPDISRYKGVGRDFYYSSKAYKGELIKPDEEGVIRAPRVVLPDSARERGLLIASVLLVDMQVVMGIPWEAASRYNMLIDLCTFEALDTESPSYSWEIGRGGTLRYGFVRERVIENIMSGMVKEGRFGEVKLFKNDMHKCDFYSVNPDGFKLETARAE
jgi:hypothetical protein